MRDVCLACDDKIKNLVCYWNRTGIVVSFVEIPL